MADYICREAVLEAAKAHYPKANEMIAGIILIPAADVRPVVISRWIEIDDYVLCANCGVAEHSPNRNYCHGCGADMRVERVKEDK